MGTVHVIRHGLNGKGWSLGGTFLDCGTGVNGGWAGRDGDKELKERRPVVSRSVVYSHLGLLANRVGRLAIIIPDQVNRH